MSNDQFPTLKIDPRTLYDALGVPGDLIYEKPEVKLTRQEHAPMATQGMITLVRDNRTVMKIVAGCNGQRASFVASLIAEHRVEEIGKLVELAYSYGLGCTFCLVVFNRTEHRARIGDELGPLYLETFDEPTFNPRWAQGTTGYLFTVDMDTWEVCDCN